MNGKKITLHCGFFSQQELSTIIKENFIQANQKNIEIHLDFYSEPQIRASTAVMNMLIGNLLRNAIAATENGDIHIKITENHLTIKDSELGLTSKVDSNGHGLGLLIVNDFL